jgi:hypothetical protein
MGLAVRAPQPAAPARRRPISSALAAFAFAALALTACGTSVQQHQARYETQLRAIDTTFTTSMRGLLAGVTPASTRARTAQVVGQFELALASVEARLRALHAPPAVARNHRRLVRSIDRYATRLRQEVLLLRSGSASALAASGQRMLTAARALSGDVAHTIAAIERKLSATSGAGG